MIMLLPLPMRVQRKLDIQFSYIEYMCGYEYTDIFPISVMSAQSILFCVLFGTSIPTLKYLFDASKSARRVRGSIPWQGAMTVALTTVVYCISNLPFFASMIGWTVQGDITTGAFLQFFRLAAFLTAINVMANFYIYALTIRSFRRFLLSWIQNFLPATLQASRNSTSAGEV